MNKNVFDVIITTFKRPDKVATLVNQLIPLSEVGKIEAIIVVDSSPVTITQAAFRNNKCVQIVRSSHPNQPYQRYLGVCKSQQTYVLFLDDDMEVLNANFATELYHYMEDAYAGVNLLFKNDNMFLAELKPSVLKQNSWGSFIRRLSGYSAVADNKFNTSMAELFSPNDPYCLRV
jgi:glycosyltransferase involved in cell wall biosynthesis